MASDPNTPRARLRVVTDAEYRAYVGAPVPTVVDRSGERSSRLPSLFAALLVLAAIAAVVLP